MSEWSYSINYGPDGEASYANVFDGEERLVGNLRIHHAVAVVNAMNAAPEMLEALQSLAEDKRLALGGIHRKRIAAVLAKTAGGSHDKE